MDYELKSALAEDLLHRLGYCVTSEALEELMVAFATIEAAAAL